MSRTRRGGPRARTPWRDPESRIRRPRTREGGGEGPSRDDPGRRREGESGGPPPRRRTRPRDGPRRTSAPHAAGKVAADAAVAPRGRGRDGRRRASAPAEAAARGARRPRGRRRRHEVRLPGKAASKGVMASRQGSSRLVWKVACRRACQFFFSTAERPTNDTHGLRVAPCFSREWDTGHRDVHARVNLRTCAHKRDIQALATRPMAGNHPRTHVDMPHSQAKQEVSPLRCLLFSRASIFSPKHAFAPFTSKRESQSKGACFFATNYTDCRTGKKHKCSLVPNVESLCPLLFARPPLGRSLQLMVLSQHYARRNNGKRGCFLLFAR